MVHIPYRGDAPLYAALIAGEIQMAMSPLSSGLAQVQGNHNARPRRERPAPRAAAARRADVQGGRRIAGLENSNWQSLLMPANTPREIVLRMQQEVAKVVHLPDVVARFRALGGAEPVGSTPEEFDARVQGGRRAGQADY